MQQKCGFVYMIDDGQQLPETYLDKLMNKFYCIYKKYYFINLFGLFQLQLKANKM